MKFTKAIVLPSLILLAMSGCSLLPPSGGVVEGSVSTEREGISRAQDTVMAEQSTRPVNPYLLNRKTIPAAAKKRFAAALSAMEAAQWKQAEQQLLSLTVDYPELSGAYLNLAICYRQLKEPTLSESYFKQSITANANNLEAYNWLALVKREQGDFSAAEKLYQQALAIWPDHTASHYNLAILCELYLGDLARARLHLLNYQKLRTEPDRKVAGWLKDLQRRIKALADSTR